MPGFLLHVGSQVLCAHGGQAQPTVPSPQGLRVGSAGRADVGAVDCGGLRASTATAGERTLRNRHVDRRARCA